MWFLAKKKKIKGLDLVEFTLTYKDFIAIKATAQVVAPPMNPFSYIPFLSAGVTVVPLVPHLDNGVLEYLRKNLDDWNAGDHFSLATLGTFMNRTDTVATAFVQHETLRILKEWEQLRIPKGMRSWTCRVYLKPCIYKFLRVLIVKSPSADNDKEFLSLSHETEIEAMNVACGYKIPVHELKRRIYDWGRSLHLIFGDYKDIELIVKNVVRNLASMNDFK